MDQYYFDPRDQVYATWHDSQAKEWLVEHGVVRSDAQIQREKLQKLLAYAPCPYMRVILC